MVVYFLKEQPILFVLYLVVALLNKLIGNLLVIGHEGGIDISQVKLKGRNMVVTGNRNIKAPGYYCLHMSQYAHIVSIPKNSKKSEYIVER